MSDKQINEVKSAANEVKSVFAWLIVICCGPIIVLGLVGSGVVMSLAASGPLLSIVGVIFLVLIGVLFYRAANQPELGEEHESTDPDKPHADKQLRSQSKCGPRD